MRNEQRLALVVAATLVAAAVEGEYMEDEYVPNAREWLIDQVCDDVLGSEAEERVRQMLLDEGTDPNSINMVEVHQLMGQHVKHMMQVLP